MRKKLMLLMLIICCVLIPSCTKDEPKEMAVRRDFGIGDYVIILDYDVPLNKDLSDSDVCIQLFHQINEYRINNGVNELQWSTQLKEAADIRAEEASQLWSHTRPNGTEWYELNPNILYGENLAKGYNSVSEVLTGWKNSYEHNVNLLYSDFKYIAIGKYENYYSAEFCY